MNTTALFQLLNTIYPLSENFRSALADELTPLSLPAHYLLVEAPRVADHIYFLETGYAMSYTFIKGKKHIEGFWPPSKIVCSARSFFDQTPSREFIQLTRDSDLLCASYNTIRHLLDSFPETREITRALLLHHYEFEKDRIRDGHKLDSTRRLDKLIKTFPGIEQAISQENIASYLGITPQTLSRIKKEAGRS